MHDAEIPSAEFRRAGVGSVARSARPSGARRATHRQSCAASRPLLHRRGRPPTSPCSPLSSGQTCQLAEPRRTIHRSEEQARHTEVRVQRLPLQRPTAGAESHRRQFRRRGLRQGGNGARRETEHTAVGEFQHHQRGPAIVVDGDRPMPLPPLSGLEGSPGRQLPQDCCLRRLSNGSPSTWQAGLPSDPRRAGTPAPRWRPRRSEKSRYNESVSS
jgi:hypothetical protein